MKILLFLLALVLAAPLSVAQNERPVKPTAEEAPAQAAADIVTSLEEAGTFTILVQALRDTGLAEALASGETYTVFAPNDEAFQQLPAGTLDGLSADELTEVLRYHVLVGAVTASDAASLSSATTVQGDDLTIAAEGDALTVNGAAVTEADIEATNGVIHVIDAVLLPADDEPARDDTAYDTEDTDDER